MDADAPTGLAYRPDAVTEADEASLVDALRRMSFGDVRMHGVVARRRVAHFGWLYGYDTWRIEPGPPLPDFLVPLRDRVAALAGVAADALVEALVTEYQPGAGIGWHRDAPMFGVVIGVSLLGPCRFRLRAGTGERQRIYTITLAPRSAYVLDGAARVSWQHMIPPTKTLRYSVTFRTLRPDGAAARGRAAGTA